VSRCEAMANLFPCVDYEVVACSRRGEKTLVQQRSIYVLIKGCRIKMRPKECLEVED